MTSTSNTLKYYDADGVVREHECHRGAGSAVLTAVPIQMRRVDCYGQTELATCDSAMSPPENSNCLDRVLIFDRSLFGCCSMMLCNNFYILLPGGRKPFSLAVRRDANFNAPKTPVPREYPGGQMMLAVENAICAPLGHHIVCEGDVMSFVMTPFLINCATPNRLVEEDNTETRCNVMTLSRALMSLPAPTSATAQTVTPVSVPALETTQNATPASESTTARVVTPTTSSTTTQNVAQTQTTTVQTPVTNTTKYYFEDGTAEEECECRTDRDSIVVVNSVVRIHRSATDGRTDVWECTADHAMTNPPPTTSGCLDRVWECANKLSNVPIACGVVQLEIFYNNTRQRIGLMARRDADAMIVIGALTTAHSVPTGSDNPAVLVMDNCVRAPLGYHIACEYEILSYDCRRPPTVAFRSRLEKHGPSFGEDDTDTRRNILILTMAMDTKTGTLAFLIKPTPKPEAPRSQTAQPTSKTVTTQPQADQPTPTTAQVTTPTIASTTTYVETPATARTETQVVAAPKSLFYVKNGAPQECKWQSDTPLRGLCGLPMHIHRSATDGRVETWTRCASVPVPWTPATGVLDRVWECNQELQPVPVLCGAIQFTFFNSGCKTIMLFARRDADANSVLGTTKWTTTTACFSADFPALLVVGNCIRAPLGHHIACESEIWSYHECWPELRMQSGFVKTDRSIEEDNTDARRNVGILRRELAFPESHRESFVSGH